MNERIKELAIQAGEFAAKTWEKQTMATFNTNKSIETLYEAKYAELIIRECASVAIQKQTENDINGIVSENPAKDFAYALIEHFGVEE
jgi:hypothetical protein